MKKMTLAVGLAVAVLAPTAAFACDGAAKTTSASVAEPKAVTVTELAGWNKEKKATAVDANNDETRATEGVIPGAVTLTSVAKYDMKELPTDKSGKLVFYCYNEQCGASHQAAKRAVEAGYKNVAVLPAGIIGWKKAGQVTANGKSKS